MGMVLKRDVPITECPWLDRDMKAGEVVHPFRGYTYGCIGPYGVACTLEPDGSPFFELPRMALVQQVAP